VDRIGDEAALCDPSLGRRVALSRLEPLFGRPATSPTVALETPHVSRKPVDVVVGADTITIENRTGRSILVDGDPIESDVHVALERLRDGISLVLGDRVVIWVHTRNMLQPPRAPELGLIGQSEAVVRLRRELGKVLD